MKEAIVVFIRRRADIRALIPSAVARACAGQKVKLFASPKGGASRVKELMVADLVEEGFEALSKDLILLEELSITEELAKQGLVATTWLGEGLEFMHPKAPAAPKEIAHMVIDRKVCPCCGVRTGDSDRTVSVAEFNRELAGAEGDNKEWSCNGPILTIISEEKCRQC